jgi:hypothetical protein
MTNQARQASARGQDTPRQIDQLLEIDQAMADNPHHSDETGNLAHTISALFTTAHHHFA